MEELGIYTSNSTYSELPVETQTNQLRMIARWRDIWTGSKSLFQWKQQLHSKHCCKGWGRVPDTFSEFLISSNNATEYGGAVHVEESDPKLYCFPNLDNQGRVSFKLVCTDSRQSSVWWRNIQVCHCMSSIDPVVQFTGNSAL